MWNDQLLLTGLTSFYSYIGIKLVEFIGINYVTHSDNQANFEPANHKLTKY